MTSEQRLECAKEICTKIRVLSEKLQANPSAPKPPPGTISKEVAGIIAKYDEPADERKTTAPVKQQPKLEELTSENIYQKPKQENNLLASIQTVVKASAKPLRLGSLAEHLKSSKEAVAKAISTPGSGLKLAKAGWIQKA